jgi:hypothetical protein
MKYYMQHILYLLELGACITGFIYWKKIKHSFWKWFPFYLAVIVIVELTGDYLNYIKDYDLKNSIYNNFSIPLEFLFFYWLYYKYAAGKKRMQLVILCMLVYLTGILLDQVYFKQTNYYFDSFSYSVGNMALLVAIISFFIQFSNSDEIIHYKSSMIFWVSLGALVFYLGSLPFYGLYNLLFKKYYHLFIFYSYFMYVCNWIMYSLFIVAFIWGKPK